MHALEQHRLDTAAQQAVLRCDNIQILRTDDHIDFFVRRETAVHAVKRMAVKNNAVVARHHTVCDVALADEVGNIAVDRLVVNVDRRADLFDVAALHDNNRVGHGQRFFLIVGDKDKRDADFLLDVFQFALHFLAQLEIQCTERLVEQQNFRLVDQRAGDGNTLLLTAGHLRDAALVKAAQTDQTQHALDLLLDDVFRLLFEIETESNIVIHVQMRKQRVFLEYRVDLALVRRQTGNILAVKQHLTVIGVEKARNDAQECGFAAAGRAEQRDEFVFMNVQRNAVEHALTVKILDDILDFNELFHMFSYWVDF